MAGTILDALFSNSSLPRPPESAPPGAAFAPVLSQALRPDDTAPALPSGAADADELGVDDAGANAATINEPAADDAERDAADAAASDIAVADHIIAATETVIATPAEAVDTTSVDAVKGAGESAQQVEARRGNGVADVAPAPNAEGNGKKLVFGDAVADAKTVLVEPDAQPRGDAKKQAAGDGSERPALDESANEARRRDGAEAEATSAGQRVRAATTNSEGQGGDVDASSDVEVDGNRVDKARHTSDGAAENRDPGSGEADRRADREASASTRRHAEGAVRVAAEVAPVVVAAIAAGPDTAEAAATDEREVDAIDAAPVDGGPQKRAAAALARLTAERSLHTGGPASGDDVSPAERGRFLGRVEGAIHTAHQRDGRIQVRLSPPELGALRIELTVQQGALSARLEAETPAARNLLLDNLPALRERLAQQDVRVERFDVDLRQETSGGGSQHGGAQDRQARESDWRHGAPRSERPRTAATAAPAAVAGRTAGAGVSDAALDVRV